MCRFHSLLLECCKCNVKCVVEVCLPNSRLLTTHSVNKTNIQAYNTFYRHILLEYYNFYLIKLQTKIIIKVNFELIILQLLISTKLVRMHTIKTLLGSKGCWGKCCRVNNTPIYRTWGSYCCFGEGRFDTGSRPSVVTGLIVGFGADKQTNRQMDGKYTLFSLMYELTHL